MRINLPKDFVKSIGDGYGQSGKKWLHELPDLLDQCSRKWGVTFESSVQKFSYNYVCNVTRKNGENAIVKLGYPGEKEVSTEMDALTIFDGTCSVRILEKDQKLGAMLLERIQPGYTITSLLRSDPEQATTIMASLIRDTPKPIPREHSFPEVKDWMHACSNVRKLPAAKDISFMKILDRTENIFNELDASSTHKLVLHGDIHHENVLYSEERGWVTIDPKGIIGDPAFNAARFLRNPKGLFSENPEKIAPWLIEKVANILNQSAKHLAGWAYIDSVLGQCWRIENGQNYEKDTILYLETLESIMD